MKIRRVDFAENTSSEDFEECLPSVLSLWRTLAEYTLSEDCFSRAPQSGSREGVGEGFGVSLPSKCPEPSTPVERGSQVRIQDY